MVKRTKGSVSMTSGLARRAGTYVVGGEGILSQEYAAHAKAAEGLGARAKQLKGWEKPEFRNACYALWLNNKGVRPAAVASALKVEAGWLYRVNQGLSQSKAVPVEPPEAILNQLGVK